VALYGCYLASGLNGVIALKSLTVIAIFAIHERRLKQMQVPALARFLFLGLAFWGVPLTSSGWGERADLVSLLFLSLLIWYLDRWDPTESRLTLWAWPCLFMIWANSHPGFAIGLAVAAIYVCTTSVERPAEAKRVLSWLALCCLAVLLNPNRFELYRYELKGLSAAPPIVEWFPTPWSHFQVYWIGLVFFWSTFLWRLRTRRFQPLWISITGVFLTWVSIRHVVMVPFFLLAMGPYAVDWGLHSIVGEQVSSWFERQRAAWIALTIVLLGLLIERAGAKAQGGVGTSQIPVQACDFIAQEHIPGPFYQDYYFGGYWIWRFAGDPPNFIDGRYPTVEGFEKLYREIGTAQMNRPEDWEVFLNRYRVNAVLLRYPAPSHFDSTFDLYFPRPRWALIYWDDLCLVFLKRARRNDSLIQRWEFKRLSPDMELTVFERRIRQLKPSDRREILQELNRNGSFHPESRRTQAFLRVCAQNETQL
jgi:hypothetical protein